MTEGGLGDKSCNVANAAREPTWSARHAAIVAALVITLSLFAFRSARADSAASSDNPPQPRLLFVDADHPSTWPQGLEPIPAGELRKLLGGGSPDPMFGTVQIEQAIYHATFRDGAIVDGRAEFTFGNVSRAMLVPLEHPLSDPSRLLDFSHLRWQGASREKSLAKGEVLYGVDRSGSRVVIAQPGRSQLECDWSLKGRSALGATEFALCLPSAVVSQIVLSVPVGLSVKSDQGVLMRGPKQPDGRNTTWQLELGSRSGCHLRILASAPPETQRVCYDQETTLIVAADRLRLQSKLQLEVFGAPLRTLRLAVPAGLHLETISYGDDFPLPLAPSPNDKAREIALELPEPLLGKGRTITVEASAATRTKQISILPQVDLSGAVRRESQVQLTVRAPLKLLRFSGDAGFTQSEAPTYSVDGEESFFLRQNGGDPPLKIELAEPAPALAVRTLARLDLRRDRCVLAADVVCTASRGSTFSVAFELPEAWDVTRVEAVGDASRIIDETTRPVAEHRKQVKIDFFRAVTDREAKRFRVEASRSLPRSGEAIVVPVIDFPAFASQEVETLVVHGSSIELNLSPVPAFAAFDPTAILSALADSPLRPERSAPGETQMLVHRWTGQTAKAQITLSRGEEAVAAHVRTSIDVGASQQISEHVDATIIPSSPLDHVLVYLSAKGSQFSWGLSTDRDRPVEGTRLAAGRHAEWNLPEGGELWDLRLPEPCRSEFHLRGTRRTSSLGGARIGLTFIPIARTFDGTAEVRLPDPAQFEIDIREARALIASPSNDPGVRKFHYERPGDVLVVRARSVDVSKSAARFVSLQLTSFLNAGGVDDFHRAEFSLTPELAPQPFRFRLANEARLCSVAVNGQPVRVQVRADEITVPALPADTSNQIQVEYQTTAARRLFCENRPISVPQARAENLGFHWRVFLAPGLQPSGLSPGWRFDEPLPALSWAERLFGPLGRSAAQMRLSSFRPDAWIVDLAGGDPEPGAWAPPDRERPPAGWSIWSASAEAISGDVSVAVWHESKFRTLAWIVCLGCAIAGLGLARFASRAVRRLGPLAIAGGVASALAAPSPYALLGGACVSGVILAVLLARPWKTTAMPLAPAEKRTPGPGSTVTFELRSLGVLLVLVTLSAMAAFAQETPRSAESLPRTVLSNPASIDAQHPHSASDSDLVVVVPVRTNRLPGATPATLPGDNELVYVSSHALDKLRRQPGMGSQNDGTALLSSDYAIALDERQSAAINATYRVAVMPGPARSLLLRLGNVTLAGANACRVDGRPYPVRKDDEGFVLTLDPNAAPAGAAPSDSAARRGELRRAIAAERPSAATTSGPPNGIEAAASPASGQPRVYEIHLTCFPNGEAKPGQFEIQIPEAAHTTFRIEKSSPWHTVTVGIRGGRDTQVHPGDAAIDVGQTNRLQIKTGPAPTETANVGVVAQAVQFLRVSPGLVEMDCRVTYDRENGAPEKFTWLVPPSASVRTTGDAYRAALRSSNATTNRPRAADGNAAEELVPLDFDCSGAPSGSLTLAATLLLPIDLSKGPTGWPVYNVRLPQFAAGGSDQSGITVTSNQVGISAPPGLRVIAATAEPNLSRTTKADPNFRQESFGSRKEPDLILDCQDISVLPLQLATLIAAHKVRLMTHEARVSADRIQWRTTAEIRTENAPAFVHVLHVDRRLKIDSISVREDDVERLVRFSQSDDEVTLFLRDRAAATQDLVLTGSLPLDAGRATKLPTVSLAHAVVSDVRLLISHDSDVDIAVSDAPGAVRLNIPRAAASQHPGDAATTPNVLEYSLPSATLASSGGGMPEVRVTRHPNAARTAGVAAMATKNLKSPVAASRPSSKTAVAPQQAPEAVAVESARQKPKVDVLASLEIRRDRSVVGSTRVLLERFVEPSLRLLWPESAVLRGALLDGRPVQPTVGDGWIAVAIPSDPIPHRLALYWENRTASSLTALARLREELPVPSDGVVPSVLISVAVPPGFRMWAPAHFRAIDPPTFARLCDVIQRTDPKPASEETSGPIRAVSAETSEATRLIGRLDVSPSDVLFSAWAVDTFWLRLPLAAAIFALIAIAAAHPYAARTGRWFLGHAPLTLALVGFAWWYCLSPRAVGPLLLVTALSLLIVDLRRRPISSSRSLPSTLQFPTGMDIR